MQLNSHVHGKKGEHVQGPTQCHKQKLKVKVYQNSKGNLIKFLNTDYSQGKRYIV